MKPLRTLCYFLVVLGLLLQVRIWPTEPEVTLKQDGGETVLLAMKNFEPEFSFKIERVTPKQISESEKVIFDDDKVDLCLFLQTGEGEKKSRSSLLNDPTMLGKPFTFNFPPKGKEVKLVAGVISITNLPGEYTLSVLKGEKVVESHPFKIQIGGAAAMILRDIQGANALRDKLLQDTATLLK